MATERQIRANRDNARRSTGPKSLEGKKKARSNAVKHGIAARVLRIAQKTVKQSSALKRAFSGRLWREAQDCLHDLQRYRGRLTCDVIRHLRADQDESVSTMINNLIKDLARLDRYERRLFRILRSLEQPMRVAD
jgi:hypothetical protein